MKVILTCQECNKEFYVIPYRAKTGKAKYCSLKCKYKNMDCKVKTGEYRHCLNCNKEYYIFPNRVKKGENKYCSIKCRAITNLGKFIGENNWNWKGEDAGYQAKHRWVRAHYGKPDTCENCGKNNLSGNFINWANISGKYLRIRSDWQRLCKSCHKRYDDARRQFA